MFGQCIRWIKRWDPRSPRPTPVHPPASAAVAGVIEAKEDRSRPQTTDFRGHADGWLRILHASELLALVQSERATEAMWRQSRLSSVVWQRDLQPALNRYAEYIQLMPASESHHHAHVGGLLAHTLEMTLAAMTWRNGHFFPEGAAVEEMDAQRDEWTYVVFFAALLHDIGKIMTDLRVSWTYAGMDAPLRWVPVSGPLTEMTQRRPGGEYLVEFTPKSARDYQAHSKLSVILLQQIAPPTALSFLARRPQAFDSLMQYLSGSDKTSLLATIIRKADQTSTQQALANGSRARFATSASVPLIDLLMQSIKDMLKSGTGLPLNRSGAAGWVYDGAIWFVAKRLADGVRLHIKQHHPEESIPGENKNDRLFDTWQEYGCIQLNPQTGQAVWYVQVHGGEKATDSNLGQAEEEGNARYTHALTMLRFPLDKLYPDPASYPPNMVGRIEIQQKRAASSPEQVPAAVQQAQAEEGASVPLGAEGVNVPPKAVPTADSVARKALREKAEPALRAPDFNRAKPAAAKSPKGTVKSAQPMKTSSDQSSQQAPETETLREGRQVKSPETARPKNKWLDFEDDAAMFSAPPRPVPRTEGATAETAHRPAQLPTPVVARTSNVETEHSRGGETEAKLAEVEMPRLPDPAVHRPLLLRAGQPEMSFKTGTNAPPRMQHSPIVLMPFLPDLPHETAGKQSEPSATAMAFVSWLQAGLASRELKYNETGAMIHFTAEGMALVSPLVFKAYVAEQDSVKDSEAEAQALQVQREVIKAGWHLMGPGKTNILKYQVLGRGGVPVGRLSAVVLIRPDRWVMPVPPSNPVLQLA